MVTRWDTPQYDPMAEILDGVGSSATTRPHTTLFDTIAMP